MRKLIDYYIDMDEKAEEILKKGQYLGKGHNGIVYLLPDNKIMKIFMEPKVCLEEYSIFKNVATSKYFPKTYKHGEYYIIRDYVGGERLDYYIIREGIDRNISVNLIKLIKEFKRLNFTRLDIRCKDIYVQENKSLMVIDPKNSYNKEVIYPRHLMKGLNKIGVLGDFLKVVKEEEMEYYNLWNFRIKRYLDRNIK
ncbi:hypothetical protein [Clostridium sp. KNHs214]|uniref:hypothetical protein n=1 Tax=Clostridium sp. KNHs214 TaxID=1540257 RepID=UPI0005523928|nr:hypothetical protein [Clostridium sp. KNHs214]